MSIYYQQTYMFENINIPVRLVDQYINEYILNCYQNIDVVEQFTGNGKNVFFQSCFFNDNIPIDDILISFEILSISDNICELKILFNKCDHILDSKFSLSEINKICINLNQFFSFNSIGNCLY
jgi:hypothetical protein